MPNLASQPTLSSLQLNLRIVSVVMFTFITYITIGLPLAVLPGYVHDVMGLSPFWAGLVISLQYCATLLSRPYAGRLTDLLGPKKIVILGLCGSFLSGVGYLLAAFSSGWLLVSLLFLFVGRVILGVGQSFVGTAGTMWGVGRVGSIHIGKVISWSGIASYGGMAVGAPLGVLFYRLGGLPLLAAVIMVLTLAAIVIARYRRGVAAKKGKSLAFRTVLGRVWPYGMALALATSGFGVIATFITLLYSSRGWEGGALSLTLFSCAFVSTRLLFPNMINRFGGMNVAALCFITEIAGLLLVGLSTDPWIAKVGAFLAGAGFSLVFPALGVVAVKMVPQQNQGSALATYTLFMDLSLGIIGPLAGIIIGWAGVTVIYLAAALLVFIALLISWQLRKRLPVDNAEP